MDYNVVEAVMTWKNEHPTEMILLAKWRAVVAGIDSDVHPEPDDFVTILDGYRSGGQMTGPQEAEWDVEKADVIAAVSAMEASADV